MLIICKKGKFEPAKQLFQSNKTLNVYKLNILHVATFMYKVNQKPSPTFFLSRFQELYHFYSTRFSELNYIKPIHNIKTMNDSVSVRGPYIWNSFLRLDTALSGERTQVFLKGTFSIHQAL